MSYFKLQCIVCIVMIIFNTIGCLIHDYSINKLEKRIIILEEIQQAKGYGYMTKAVPTDPNERFGYAINVILSNEGSYSNNPYDKGGETKFGISKRSYPNLDIKNLTIQQAKDIYKRDFWDPGLYKDIKDIQVAIKIFDLAVNMGSKWAHKLTQRALKSTGQNIAEDGVLGQTTLDAINKADSTDLLAALKSEAAGYYRTLVAIKSKQTKFLKGWLKRAYT